MHLIQNHTINSVMHAESEVAQQSLLLNYWPILTGYFLLVRSLSSLLFHITRAIGATNFEYEN